jgi:hypothetical protein
LEVYFSTVTRGAPLERGGTLVRLDWDAKRVLGEIPVVPTEPSVRDPNPRGGARGGRGVQVVGDQVMVGSYHTLLFCSRDLEVERRITHPLLAGIHETHLTGDGRLWVAATAVDAALLVDLDKGDVVDARWPRESPALQARLGVTPLDIDKEADNRQRWLLRPERSDRSHLHLNAVCPWRDELYALCTHPGVIVNLDREEVVVEDRRLKGAHNLTILEDGTALTSGTTSHSVEVWDLAARRSVRSIPLDRFPWVRRVVRPHLPRYAVRRVLAAAGIGQARAHPLFVRGQRVMGDRVLVGLAPASILLVDWVRGTLVDAYQHADDVEVCVHGIAVAP